MNARIIGGALVTVLFATAGQAYAQSDTDLDGYIEPIEEIVTTATRHETSLMQTPVAVSIFDEEDLDKLGISNVKDLNNIVPNMSIMVDVESNAPIITMRGVRSTNTTEWGDPAVGVHYDGVYSPRPQGALAMMFDIERVEAMRGPQGTLYGRNSTVGTINIISARPDFNEYGGKIDAEYGRWDHQSVKGVFNVPVSDKFAMRFAAFIEKRESNLTGYYDPNQWDQRYLREAGYLDSLTPVDTASTEAGNNFDFFFFFNDQLYEEIKADPSDFYNSVDQAGYRLSTMWAPSDNVEWLLSFERYRDKAAGGINARDCKRIRNRPSDVNGGTCTDIWGTEDNFVAYANVPGLNDMTLDSIRSHFTWQLSDSVSLTYNYGFQSQERVGQIDLDQGLYFWDQMLKWVDTDYDSHSHELLFKSVDNEKFQWVAGYFNFEEDNYMNGQYHGAMGGVSLWLQPERVIKSDAFFGQMTYGLTDKLFLTAGVRNTNDSKQDKGGRNYGCWGGCYPAEAWAMVRWDLIDWGNFGNIDAQSEEYLATTSIPRDTLNALSADALDYPTVDFNVDTINDVKATWGRTTWRLGLDYDISDNTMIYAYVADGYKGGGVGDVIIKPSDGERFDTSYEEETVTTYEFGVKTKAMDGRMQLSANYFYSDYEDQQFTTWFIYDSEVLVEPDPETGIPIERIQEYGTFLTRNAAKSKISGLELEMQLVPWENGFISGFVTTLDTKIDADYWKAWGMEAGQVFAGHYQGPLDTSLPWFRNLKGNDLAYSPELALNFNMSHTFQFASGASLTPFLHVHWESESYTSIDNADKWDLDPSVLNPGIDLDIYSDKRDAWGMGTFSMNYGSADDRWFAEGYVYNFTNEDVNWWQGYAGNTPMAAKAQRTWGLRFGMTW